MINALHQRQIPLVIANARLSARSAAGYKKIGGFMRDMLRRITLIAAQNQEDGDRFIELGLKRSQLTVTGSLKFDISVTPELAARAVTLRRQWAPRRPVWIATSTHGFTNCGTGGDDIIHQHYATLQRAADQRAAFTVGFRLFTVEAVRHVAVVMFGQRDGGGGGDRNAFIRRAEQQIEVNAGIYQRFSIKTPQQRKVAPGIEQAGVEEIWAGTAGFQGELAEFQYLLVKRKLDKLALVGFHHCFSSS